MKRVTSLAASFAVLITASAGAQRVQPPPPPMLPPSPADPAADPLTPFVVAKGEIESPKGKMPLQLLISGDDAAVRGILPGETWWRYLPIGDNPTTALRLLADRRLAFLWPRLLSWTGPDLGELRRRMVAKAERAYETIAPATPQNSADSTVRPPTRALLQLANALSRAGYVERAIKMLEEERARRTLKTEWDQMEWSILTVREGNILIGDGRYDDAVTLMANARRTIGQDNAFGLNLDVNRAAALANAGRYAEALAAVTAARSQFDGGKKKKKDSVVSLDGSDRQFEWIRGCALNGLGRRAEARAALTGVLGAPEPADPFFKTESGDQLRFRVYICTRDATAMARYLTEGADTAAIAPIAFLLMQPAWRTTNDPGKMLEATRTDAGLKIAAARWMRELPPELIPALNGWR